MFNNDGAQRPKFTPKDGESWTCAKCGGAIQDLPFDPRRGPDGAVSGKIFHRECLPPRRDGGGFRGGDRPRFRNDNF